MKHEQAFICGYTHTRTGGIFYRFSSRRIFHVGAQAQLF
jgi:hypothetical protein